MIACCHPSNKTKSLQQFINLPQPKPQGALGNLDWHTGIPWPAEVPDDTSNLGVYGSNPLTFDRSELAQVWFTAKEITISAPTGVHIVTVPNIFNETGTPLKGAGDRNPYKSTGGSFCYPLSYPLYNDDKGDSGVNLSFQFVISYFLGPTAGSIALQGDNMNHYYPFFAFDDFDGMDSCSTSAFPGSPSVGTLNFLGSGLSCDIRGPGSYGNVDISITKKW